MFVFKRAKITEGKPVIIIIRVGNVCIILGRFVLGLLTLFRLAE